MKLKALIILGLTLPFIFILSACGATDNTNQSENSKLTIFTTVYPLQFFTEKIGGDFVQVNTIYPPGADEHTYEPSQKDIIDLAEGDFFFYIGHGLEGFVENAKPILEDEGVQVIAIGEKINLDSDTAEAAEHESHEETETDKDEEGHEGTEEDSHDAHGEGTDVHDEHQHGTVDPHLWIDPVYTEQLAHVILDTLIEEMPEQQEYFEANFATIENELHQLNEQFTEVTANAKHSEFLVSHAAYGYWEARYGIQQINISGISTSDEPSQKELANIINEVQDKNLKYVLVEQNVQNKLVDVIQNEANIAALPVHNLSVLTEEDINDGEDYFSIMQKNIDSLEKALNE